MLIIEPTETPGADRKNRDLFIRDLVVIVSIILILIESILKTYLELSLSFGTPLFFRIILFILIAVIIFTFKGQRRKQLIYSALLAVTILVSVESSAVSDRIFLGKRIAKTTIAEAPGTYGLFLYNDGRYKITRNGMFGEMEHYYGNYKTVKDSVLVYTRNSILELNGKNIDIDSRQYTIIQSLPE